MYRVTRHHTRKHRISTNELEAKLGIHDIRHYAHSRVLRYLGHVFRMDADRTPSLLQRCWVVDGKQPRAKPLPVSVAAGCRRFLGEGELQSRRATVQLYLPVGRAVLGGASS
jgi:hypothetical protein